MKENYSAARLQHFSELERLADWAWGWIMQTQVIAKNRDYQFLDLTKELPQLGELRKVLDELSSIAMKEADAGLPPLDTIPKSQTAYEQTDRRTGQTASKRKG